MTSDLVIGHGSTLAQMPVNQFVPSEGDSRVINNVMRHDYRVLNEYEKDYMVQLKDIGLDFIALLYEIAGYDMEEMPPEGTSFKSRELSLAATNMEQAVLWAVKHVTR